MYYAKENKSVRERQIPYDLTHMWNLRKKTDEQMGRGRKGERETNHKRLLKIENKLKVDKGGQGMGSMCDGYYCYDEHWVLYVRNESLNSTPETNIALQVN